MQDEEDSTDSSVLRRLVLLTVRHRTELRAVGFNPQFLQNWGRARLCKKLPQVLRTRSELNGQRLYLMAGSLLFVFRLSSFVVFFCLFASLRLARTNAGFFLFFESHLEIACGQSGLFHSSDTTISLCQWEFMHM